MLGQWYSYMRIVITTSLYFKFQNNNTEGCISFGARLLSLIHHNLIDDLSFSTLFHLILSEYYITI